MSVPRGAMLELAKRYIVNAYAPYSGIRVSAVAYGCGELFPGVNVENASYGLTICAERSAIFRMVSEGCLRLEALLVYSPDIVPYPCGACRQVMAEFGSEGTPVRIVSPGTDELLALGELLPRTFKIERPDREHGREVYRGAPKDRPQALRGARGSQERP